jgi:signal transduction histidine kinase
LPDHSVAYYLHVFEDGNGHVQIPASALEQLSAAANVPFYSHSDSYLGRGIVGGRVFSFETAGIRAAQLGLRIFAGESPEQIGIQPGSENDYVFDWRQLQRWGISESDLPSGSIVRFKEYTVWDRYQWQIAGVVLIVVMQSLLIAGLIAQRLRRRRAERELRTSQKDRQELTGKLIVAQESECSRIARELHDDFGQELALLSVEIDLLRQAPPETNGRFLPRVEKLSARVKQLSSTIHNLSHQLHPMKLEQLGLVAALGALCKELAESHSVSIAFIHEQVPEPDRRESALCLYRIAQEALRNVVKHSGARHCEVELRGNSNALSLRIHDDGKGFDPTSVTGRDGLGLVSMRERLRVVHGDIVIASEPSAGTTIDVHVPLLRAVATDMESVGDAMCKS